MACLRVAALAMLSVVLLFGMVAATSAAAPDSKAQDIAAIKDKIARVESFRVSQEEREAAAERIKLQKAQLKSSTGSRMLAAAPSLVPSQGGIPDMFGTTANWAYSPPLRKFVDKMPGLGASNANNLGQFISVAKPDTKTYPGSDYYEIELRQFTEKLHSDLPPTTLRGYVQVNKGTDSVGNNTLEPDPIHYLGPFIVATKDRPVRIKFTNKLPTGEAGDLFIPCDTSVMGAGEGPIPGEMYTQNRGTLHLHGGHTPWISDGTPHQWITPAGEDTPYPKGVSVKNVPDMPDPGDGSQTFFYTNDQSARLMFYHDHSYGITRLNVYAGEAAGYMIQDAAEKKLIDDGTIPSEQIPVIVQDKTFVDENTVLTTDPTWNWGTGIKNANGIRAPKTGDLWLPHVYVPAQNPADAGGMNATGRWHFGPWFWPPIPDSMIKYPPIPNPYYDPINAPWEPEEMPATPNPSMGMEAFHDTAMVNGTAYPVLEVDPKSYRMRILNASGDRFFNLQMYVADPTVVTSDGRTDTEVKMVPAVPTSGYPETWPTDGREGGAPDPAMAGPEWVQIGTEGGFLPKPAVIPQQPITWNADPTTFNMGNVQDHSLLVAPAERADVIVDFSQYAGKTLILYNDAPSAFPALDARTDYYTGMPDMTDTGGPAGTEPGFGPNTRTVMQIKVAAKTPAPAFDLAGLETAFASTNSTQGVFAASQNPIIVPDSRYNSTYNSTFSADPYVRIWQNDMAFKTLDSRNVTIPLEPKAIQDETSEVWDYEYGRMSGKLGLEMPRTNAGNANFILYSFFDPVTENLQDSMTPLSPVGEDGTQIWKITHNGVDTHPIHFHLFDVQVINRVGWDNAIRPPDDNELGWKDTVRVSPLEDTIVALKPVAPKVDFGLPDSVRPLNPTAPIGSTMGFSNLSPVNGQPIVPPVTNQMVNFGWEYVWHCHILSHEEMDMMRPMSLAVARSLPATPALAGSGLPGAAVDLVWTDPTPPGDPNTPGNPANEIGYRLERAEVSSTGVESTYSVIATPLANQTTYTDNTTIDGRAYRYKVVVYNAATGGIESNTVTIAPPLFFATYTITPTAGIGGTISPSTPQGVVAGSDSPTFTITADPGYMLTDVLIDGVSVGTGAEHKFFNVTADHTIWAVFARDTFTITPSAGANGNISPNWQQVVDRGADSQTFTFSPNVGYHVVNVLVDGVPIGIVDSYTFNNVTADHTIDVLFEINTYTINASASVGGTITPSGAQMVMHGADSAMYTITPDTGYYIADVKVDGVSKGAITSFQFTNVKAAHTIEATFALKTVTRYSGSPIANALTVAQAAYPGWTGVQYVVIASADTAITSQFEAATAPGLAKAYNAPLLLVSKNSLNTSVRDALVAMPDGVKVKIVGGRAGVSSTVYNAIKATAGVAAVERVTGSDRYGTAVEVAKRMKSVMGAAFPNTVFLATAEQQGNITDSVAASVVTAKLGYPVLYIKNNSVPTVTSVALFDLGLTNRYVLGGTGAVTESARAAAGVPATNRIGDTTRAGTMAAFAQRAKTEGWLTGTRFGVAATGGNANFAAVFLAKQDAPILLAARTSVPVETSSYLTANKAGINGGFVFGPTSSIGEPVRQQLLALIQ